MYGEKCTDGDCAAFPAAVLIRFRPHPFALGVALALAPLPAFSAPTAYFPGAPPPKEEGAPQSIIAQDEPVLLEASRVDYDHETNTVIASGKVEITQGATIILADRLIYKRGEDKLMARGNVSMLEPSGNVYFADEVELYNNMKTGVVKQFKGRLSDDSLFVAAQANKVDENRIELFKAAYTPCRVCDKSGKPKTPFWKMRADHILIDEQEQKVTYDDAYFDMFGLPVFYTPYFSHPTPDADSKSGILMPEYQHSDTLGWVVKVPVYYAIAPDKDATITPFYTSAEGLVMLGEYRQRFNQGGMEFKGSITNPGQRNALGDLTDGKEIRGHIFAKGDFALDEHYGWGFDINRTTDDTYLRRYRLKYDTLLTSRVYAEGRNFAVNDRSYAVVQGLSFQGLTAQDNPDTMPVVAPQIDIKLQSDPGMYNSRFLFNANAMSLFRDEGTESRRLSGTLAWKLPYISDDGQVIELTTQLRSDVYHVSDVLLENGRMYDGMTGRVSPQLSALWRYPFINRFETVSMLMEPVVNFTLSSNGGNPAKIPNEDSLVPEFTDTNLFSSDRFAGYDRVETGPRVSYGLRGGLQFYSGKYVDWLIGQQYRVNDDPNFPISNDLDSRFSDYVGRVGFNYRPFNIAYRFRLDKNSFSPKRSEIDAGVGYDMVSLNLAYLSLQDDPVLASKEQVAGSMTINLNKNWAWNVTANHDLFIDEFVNASMGLTYANECINIAGVVGRQYTQDRDIEPSTTVLFKVTFRNLD